MCATEWMRWHRVHVRRCRLKKYGWRDIETNVSAGIALTMPTLFTKVQINNADACHDVSVLCDFFGVFLTGDGLAVSLCTLCVCMFACLRVFDACVANDVLRLMVMCMHAHDSSFSVTVEPMFPLLFKSPKRAHQFIEWNST